MTDPTPVIRVKDIAYVQFVAPDLEVMESFLLDFGLVRHERSENVLSMRGLDRSGPAHITRLGETACFDRVGFCADSKADLDALSATEDFADVRPIEGSSGGYVVSGRDPNGFAIDVIAERKPLAEIGELARPAPVSNSVEGRRRRGEPIRLVPSPSQVFRIGHCVLNVADFARSERWYKHHLGLVTSDQIDLAPNTPVGAFLRCDRGAEFVDHHTVFLLQGEEPGFNHAAFEVVNFDDLMSGHTHLQKAGHRHQWGIGRHILGSQIYDYWRDPYGNVLEHWTDGDLFNNETPPASVGLAELIGSQWGPTSGGPA